MPQQDSRQRMSDDELHFLLQCNLNEQDRRSFLDAYPTI